MIYEILLYIALFWAIIVESIKFKEIINRRQERNMPKVKNNNDCSKNCSRVQFLEKVNEDNQAEIEYLRKALKEEQLRCSLMQQEMMKLRKK